jgi:5-methylcytosine-specific restriction endonuclease McrA
MRYIVSRYNHDVGWLKDYTDDVVMYDRSDARPPVEGAIVVPNILRLIDLYDKIKGMRTNYRHSEETKRKISEAKKGKKFTAEHRKNLSLSHIGNPGYWTGKKRVMTDEWRKNISIANIGKHTDFTNLRRGKRNNKWKGGITPINAKIRKSPEYKAWRKAIFERDNYTCQICDERGGHLNADHIKPFAYFPELRFELSNGRTLCLSCHRKTDTWGAGLKPRK